MEHKKFFVKDFIQYASPCFGCGKAPNFRILFLEKNEAGQYVTQGTIVPIVTDKHIQVDLSIKYGSSLRLWILPKFNQFITNDNAAFSNYIVKRSLSLVSECNCGTRFESNNLEFQTFNKVIGPTTLRYEYISFQEKDTKYTLYSDFGAEKTKANVSKIAYTRGVLHTRGTPVGPIQIQTPSRTKDLEFNLPLLPKYKMRSKEHLIEKLRIYTIFS